MEGFPESSSKDPAEDSRFAAALRTQNRIIESSVFFEDALIGTSWPECGVTFDDAQTPHEEYDGVVDDGLTGVVIYARGEVTFLDREIDESNEDFATRIKLIEEGVEDSK